MTFTLLFHICYKKLALSCVKMVFENISENDCPDKKPAH